MLDDNTDRRLGRIENALDTISRRLTLDESGTTAAPVSGDARAELEGALRRCGYRLNPSDLDRLSAEADYERFKRYVTRYATELDDEQELVGEEVDEDEAEDENGKSRSPRKSALPRTRRKQPAAKTGTFGKATPPGRSDSDDDLESWVS